MNNTPNKTIDVKSSTVINIIIGDNKISLSKDEATQLYYSLENELGIRPENNIGKQLEDAIKNLPKYPQYPPTIPIPGQDWAPNTFPNTYKYWEHYNINNVIANAKCMHDSCPSCKGKGIKSDGTPCIHNLSCPCPKCTPYCSTNTTTI